MRWVGSTTRGTWLCLPVSVREFLASVASSTLSKVRKAKPLDCREVRNDQLKFSADLPGQIFRPGQPCTSQEAHTCRTPSPSPLMRSKFTLKSSWLSSFLGGSGQQWRMVMKISLSTCHTHPFQATWTWETFWPCPWVSNAWPWPWKSNTGPWPCFWALT